MHTQFECLFHFLLCLTHILKVCLLPSEAFDSLKEADKLLICELSIEENEKDTQIVYAYEAEITY